MLEPPWIRQLAADIFGIPVQYMGAVDASVLGAVRLARIATGELTWAEVEHDSATEEGVVTYPDPRAATRRTTRAFARWPRRLRQRLRVCTTPNDREYSMGGEERDDGKQPRTRTNVRCQPRRFSRLPMILAAWYPPE